ncbi:MAG TPA: T6SS immunity protein Tdi1 domain-containing protein [Blastocatellia bacterium]|nr:T6SS immunity protein Tdi1 domain-containing protein [Blastocatellia bacterium]
MNACAILISLSTMKITWDDLTVNFEDFQSEDLLEDWRWLIGDSAQPILISSIGDAFLQDETGKIFWLETGVGVITEVAPSFEAFKTELNDQEKVSEWFLVPIIAELKALNILLERGQCYSYKQPPILSGEYEASNFEPANLSVHFSISGQICLQVKDLPAGTEVGSVTLKDQPDQ